MLLIEVKGLEQFDSETNRFSRLPDTILKLEHSLVSISKWEAKHQITFLSDSAKTSEQVLDYIRCMSVSGDISNETLMSLSEANINDIKEYIQSKQSATRFLQQPTGGGSREKITSELIYYWMIALQIPWEAQYWHLERLLTLVEVCQRKNQASQRKGNRTEMARHRNAINAQRRQQYGTLG